MTVIAEAKAYDATTREWTKPVRVELRTRMEAINWVRFNRDWMKDFRIDGQVYV